MPKVKRTVKNLPGVVKCKECGLSVKWDEYIELPTWEKFIKLFRKEHVVHNSEPVLL